MSAVVPTAADPDHLEQEFQSGELDLHVRTTRLREDKKITVSISSGFLGRRLREKVLLHGTHTRMHTHTQAQMPAYVYVIDIPCHMTGITDTYCPCRAAR